MMCQCGRPIRITPKTSFALTRASFQSVSTALSPWTSVLHDRPRTGGRVPRAKRRRQVHDDADDHAILRARRRAHPARRRAARRRRTRREAPDRVPPGEQSPVRRDARGRVSRLRRRVSRDLARASSAARRWTTRWQRRRSRSVFTARSASCPRGSASGSGWRRRSCTAPTCSCWTSRRKGSTRTSGSRSVS